MAEKGAPAQREWRKLPVAPDLQFAVRDDVKGLAAEVDRLQPGAAALAGDLAAFPPSDLLNFLHHGGRNGVLLTRSHGVERAIVLLEGNVAWACSTSPGERFGELICRLGLVRREALDATLADQLRDHSHRRVGQMLGERGLLEPEDVWRALRHQIVEIFLGLLVLREGSFVFLRDVDTARLPAQLALDTEALLLDGLRRLDEMEFFRTVVPAQDTVVCPTAKAGPAPEFSPEMLRLWSALDGQTSLDRLAESTALGEFEATKAACKLIQGGWATLAP